MSPSPNTSIWPQTFRELLLSRGRDSTVTIAITIITDVQSSSWVTIIIRTDFRFNLLMRLFLQMHQPLTRAEVTTIIARMILKFCPSVSHSMVTQSARPLDKPRKSISIAERRELSSTKKSKRWERLRCAETWPCTSLASMVTPVLMPILRKN